MTVAFTPRQLRKKAIEAPMTPPPQISTCIPLSREQLRRRDFSEQYAGKGGLADDDLMVNLGFDRVARDEAGMPPRAAAEAYGRVGFSSRPGKSYPPDRQRRPAENASAALNDLKRGGKVREAWRER
jgi:hypothetical protein